MPPLEPIEGSLAYSPLLLNEKEARGSYKKPGEPLTVLSLRIEAKGLSLQLCQDPATQARARGDSANKPLLPNEKVARGSYKKPGEPLTALSLRAEAKGLFLQPCRDLVTQARIRGGSAKQPLLSNEKDA